MGARKILRENATGTKEAGKGPVCGFPILPLPGWNWISLHSVRMDWAGSPHPALFLSLPGLCPHSTLPTNRSLFLSALGSLYHITLLTFLIALGHFLSEVFVYGTAAPTIGVLAPLMVASFSILGMLIGLQYLDVDAVSRNKKKN